jgi:hypothetical protein
MKKEAIKIKRDIHFKRRGGYARIIKVKCKKCKRLLFIYQKDGPGWLKRCYFNRILWPQKYSSVKEKNIKNLICECGETVGITSRHVFRSDGITPDGRLAFELIKGKFERSYPPKIK